MRNQFKSACFLLAAVLLFALAAGCGRRASQGTAGTPPVRAAGAPLPEWAPKNPSPEFLRVARMLKPLPAELWRRAPAPCSGMQAMQDRMVRIYPAAWEFFGTLTDEQIHQFLTRKPVNLPGEQSQASTRVLIPVKSLSRKQRAALDRYFEDWRKAMSGLFQPDDPRAFGFADRLVALYRFGAKEDLSNVDAGFNVAGHSVNITFRIRMPDGTVRSGLGSTIATL